jgi:hypothetical protein
MMQIQLIFADKTQKISAEIRNLCSDPPANLPVICQKHDWSIPGKHTEGEFQVYHRCPSV